MEDDVIFIDSCLKPLTDFLDLKSIDVTDGRAGGKYCENDFCV